MHMCVCVRVTQLSFPAHTCIHVHACVCEIESTELSSTCMCMCAFVKLTESTELLRVLSSNNAHVCLCVRVSQLRYSSVGVLFISWI